MSLNGYTPREVSAMWNLIDTYVRWKNYNTQKDRKYFKYHPSEWGKCLRMQQYKHLSQLGVIDFEYPDLSSQKIRLFDKGHNMHKRWSSYFDSIGGILMGHWKCTNPLCYLFNDNGHLMPFEGGESAVVKKVYEENKSRIYAGENGSPIFKPNKCACGCSKFDYEETPVISEECNIDGHADLVINCENLDPKRFDGVRVTFDRSLLPMGESKVVADMKTVGSNAWKNQIKVKGAHKEYIVQLTIYIHVLECDYGIIMYENKDTSDMYWHKVSRNNQWWEIIKWQASKMIQWSDKGILPPPKATTKNDFMCMYCPFKKLCHESKVWEKNDLDEMRKYFYKSLL